MIIGELRFVIGCRAIVHRAAERGASARDVEVADRELDLARVSSASASASSTTVPRPARKRASACAWLARAASTAA